MADPSNAVQSAKMAHQPYTLKEGQDIKDVVLLEQGKTEVDDAVRRRAAELTDLNPMAVRAGETVFFNVKDILAHFDPVDADEPVANRKVRLQGRIASERETLATLQAKMKKDVAMAADPGIVQTLEGKITEITYKAPDDRSTLEIFRNYTTEFKNNGFTEIFSCANETCGGMPFSYTVVNSTPMVGVYADQRYYAGKLKRAEGDVYVSLYVNFNKGAGKKYANIKLDVIEVAPMEAGLVKVDADAMAKEILKEGHVAIYGIYFDTAKSNIKPESKATLDEIAKLLKDNPTLKLVVVGHTDNVGAFNYNMDLSKRRAAAVQSALTSTYAIDGGRLKSWGIGYLSPVASNKHAAGQAKNRRVELVEQ